MTDVIQINNIKRQIGTLGIIFGIKNFRDAISDFETKIGTFSEVLKYIKGLNIQSTQYDITYKFASFDTCEKIIESLNPIAKEFGWVAEFEDCDDRAKLMSALVSMLFLINTNFAAYCEVYEANTGKLKYLHYANLIVAEDGKLIFWDVDYNGKFQRIFSNDFVMGENKYHLISIK